MTTTVNLTVRVQFIKKIISVINLTKINPVNPKMKIGCKCTHPQAIQDVDESFFYGN